MPAGVCKLCRNEESLVSSHFFPASLYQYCRQAELSPIKIGDGAVYPTDRQTQAYLLCRSCEDVLSAGGETWVGPRLATWERTFPLFDLLSARPPDYDEDGVKIFFANRDPEIKVEKLLHFAMGIFWKASVHSWTAASKAPRIELGPYSNEIGGWLREQRQFPKHVYLSLAVATPKAAQITLLEPYRTVATGWHSYMFHVPGLLFMLDIGKTVETASRWMSLNDNPLRPVPIYDGLFGEIAQLMAAVLHRSRKTKAYERAMLKVAAARGFNR